MRRFSNLTNAPSIVVNKKDITFSNVKIIAFNTTINGLNSVDDLERLAVNTYIESDGSIFRIFLYKISNSNYGIINANNINSILNDSSTELNSVMLVQKYGEKINKEVFIEELAKDAFNNNSNTFSFLLLCELMDDNYTFNFYCDNISTDEVVIGEIKNPLAETYNHEKISFDYDILGKCKLDLFDSSIEYNIFEISTSSDYPLSVSSIYKKNTNGFFGKNIVASFEYKIRITNDYLELINPNGDSLFYILMDRTKAKDEYNIDASSYTGDLYVDLINYSCIVRDTLINYYLVSRDDTVVNLRCDDYSLNTLHVARIISTTTSLGVINYNWTLTHKLSLISNNKTYIQFSYNNNDLIERISIDRGRYCLFEYASINGEKYLTTIKYCNNNNPTKTEIVNYLIKLEYDNNSNHLQYVYDDLTKIGVKFEYNIDEMVSKISNVLMNSNEYSNFIQVDKTSEYTKITNHLGQSTYYYLNNSGKCYLMIDDDSNYKFRAYQENGVIGSVPLLTGESSKISKDDNLLKNSFLFFSNASIFDWQKNTTNITLEKACGIDAFPSIRLYGNSTEQFEISQTISDLSSISYDKIVFSAYARGNGIITLSIVINGVETGQNYVISNDWQEIKLNVNLPNNLSSLQVIIKTSINADLYLSNLYLGSEKLTVPNLLLNGNLDAFSYNDNTDHWEKQNFTSNDFVQNAIVNLPLSNLIKKELLLSGTLDNEKCLYQELSINGTAGESLTFSFFVKANINRNDNCYSFIRVDYYSLGEVEYRSHIDSANNQYELNRHSIITESSYRKITVGIVYYSRKDSTFSAFSLTKGEVDNYYNYNENNNLQQVLGNNDLSISFNNKSSVKRIQTATGDVYEYNYLNNGKIESIKDANGNSFFFQYDENGYLTENKIESFNKKIITKTIQNNPLGDPLLIKDYDGISNAYEYDNNDRVIKKNNHGGLVEHFNYNSQDLIINKKYDLETNVIEHNFGYNNKNDINSISITNNSSYDFNEYDNWSNIKKIYLDNNLINSFNYLKVGNNYTGLISNKQYPNGTYNFTYDNKQRLTEVTFENTTVSNYEYDQNNNLKSISDAYGLTSYVYDSSNRIKSRKIVSGNSEYITNYEYDNLGNAQQKTHKINNTILNYNYDYLYEHSEYTQGGYFSRLDNIFQNDIIFEEYDLLYGDQLLYSVPQHFDQELNRKCFRFSLNSHYLKASVDAINIRRNSIIDKNNDFKLDKWREDFKNSKSIFFWIRINSINNTLNNTKLLTLSSDSADLVTINYNANGYISVNYGNEHYEYKKVLVGEWNLIGIEINREVLDNNPITNISQFVNHYKDTRQVNDDFTSDITKITFGDENLIGTDLSATFDILYVSIGNNVLSQSSYLGIYNEGVKYVFTQNPLKSKGVMYYNQSKYSGLDLITLNGTLKSIKGLKPIEYTYADSSFRLNKTKLFKLDSKKSNIDDEYTLRHIYGSFNDEVGLDGKTKTMLSYDLGIKNKGMISFRFKINQDDNFSRQKRRTLLTIPSNGNGSHRLLIELFNWNQTIKLYYNGYNSNNFEDINTRLTVMPDEWHRFTVTWNETNIIIKLDNRSFTHSLLNQIDISNCKTYLGCNLDGHMPMNELNGIIEMLAFKNDYLPNIHETLCNSGALISHVTSLDELDRIVKKEIITNEARLKHIYHYNDEYDDSNVSYNASLYPSVEDLEDGTKIIYTHDRNGNITSKTTIRNEIISETIRYEYDVASRLLSEICYNGDNFSYHYKYVYNDNSDIISMVSYDANKNVVTKDIYNYSSTIKSQLQSINHYLVINNQEVLDSTDIISYSSNDPFRPSSYKGNNLTWIGRRLTSFGTNSYQYNFDGIRISKITQNGTHSYVLDDKKIIKETNPIYGDVYYHYDDEGMIVGFHYDGNEYLYVKDLTGNIISIIDEAGNSKVEYKYDAWGKVISVTGDNIIKNVNSFLYKGYYYDFETGLYYCNSRYYDPSICRWVSIDDISFLDKESLSGINLWCYCDNNPIMGYDPDGLWSIKKFFQKVLSVVIIVAALKLAVIFLPLTVGITIMMPSKEEHYDRNKFNSPLPKNEVEAKKLHWNSKVAANAHQFSATNGRNVKYVSLDGKREVIFNSKGESVSDPRDIGTYNYCPTDVSITGHAIKDVLPWIIWGNNEDDSTNILDRVWGLLFG